MVVNTIEGCIRVHHRVLAYRSCNGFARCGTENYSFIQRPTCKHRKSDGYFFMTLAICDTSLIESNGNVSLYMLFFERDSKGSIDWTQATSCKEYGVFNLISNRIISTSPNANIYGT